MSILARCKFLFNSMVHRRSMEQELKAELEEHIAMYAEEMVRSGVARDLAERRARAEVGPFASVEEQCREAVGLRLVDEAAQDLRYTWRMLRKNPGFAAVAIVTLAIGIGLNSAIFTLANAWVLRPLPYPNPNHLLVIWTFDPKHNGQFSTSAADLYDWRGNSEVFEQICGLADSLATITLDNTPKQMSAMRVNADFFRMLGVTPKEGRDFLPEDDLPGAAPVTVLSDELWRDAFGADPTLIGKTITIDGTQTTVIGILPRDFHLPWVGRVSLWVPLALSGTERADRSTHFLRVIGRTRPEISASQARDNLKAVADQLAKAYPDTDAGHSVALATLQDEIGRKIGKEPILFTFGLVGCVLLLACANVTNIIVGRAMRRQQEMAIRLAIGASRARLLRQLLTENLVLFFAAAAVSIELAQWSLRWMQNSLSYELRGVLPNQGNLQVDLATLVYTFAIAMLAGAVFGFAPVVRCWRIDVNHALKGSSSQASGDRTGVRLKNVLVVTEMALALVVSIASGLLARGMMRIYSVDPGFNPRGLFTARFVLSDPKYVDPMRDRSFFRELLNKVKPLPGVAAVGAAQFVPYDRRSNFPPYVIEGRPDVAPVDRPRMIVNAVTPDYFGAIGIPLVRGRLLSEQDRPESDLVGVINQTMAKRQWTNENPIGRRIRFGPMLDRRITIVGIVGNTEGQSETEMPRSQVYVSAWQLPLRTMTLVARTKAQSNMADLGDSIRHSAREVDPGQAVYNVETMESLQADWFGPIRIAGEATALFGAISLFLAAIGIYSVMAYSVVARKREFGIRMALGATPGMLRSMMLRQGMKLATIGLVLGLAGSLATTRFLSLILYHVSPTDLLTFTLTTVLMLVVAALACYVPALRASQLDPLQVLHDE